MKTKIATQLLRMAFMNDSEMTTYLSTVSEKRAWKLYSAASSMENRLAEGKEGYTPSDMLHALWLIQLNTKARGQNHIKSAA